MNRARLLATIRNVPRLLPLPAGIAGVVLILMWMSGAFRNKIAPGIDAHEKRSVADLTVVPVTKLQTTQRVDAVGTVQPRHKTDVAARLLATIDQIEVEPGDRVEAGDLLITLDDREIQAQLRETEAAVAGIEADLAVRLRDYDRYKQMVKEGAVTKEDFDRVEGTIERLFGGRLLAMLRHAVDKLGNQLFLELRIRKNCPGFCSPATCNAYTP